jgi:hypothetical protein
MCDEESARAAPLPGLCPRGFAAVVAAPVVAAAGFAAPVVATAGFAAPGFAAGVFAARLHLFDARSRRTCTLAGAAAAVEPWDRGAIS